MDTISEPLQDILTQILLYLPRIIAALVIFVISLVVSGLATRSVKRALKIRVKDPETLQLLVWLTRWSIVILGGLVALDQVNFDVVGFFAGLGIAGFTIGFALQDIARNFVAGIILLIRQPFDIGDAIGVGSHSGTVLEIKLRDTVIKTWDGELLIIPNIDVFNNAITNYSDLPERRRTVAIGLGYEEDVDKSVEVFLNAVRQVPGVLEDPAPTVYAKELGDSALILTAQFWLNQDTHDLFTVHSNAVKAIKEAAEREGIDLPYPTQTVHLRGDTST
jgi:small-conductance mechanosensitive channel